MSGAPPVPARFCTRCGSERPGGARFCTRCGASFDEAPAAPAVSAPPDVPARPYPVQLALPYEPLPSRPRTAARWPLALPYLVLWLVLIAACAVTAPLGWLAAVVTGRLPGTIRRFHTAVLAYVTRTSAYLAMATDVPPPMPWRSGEAHPVQVAVSPPARLPWVRTLLIVPLAIPAVATAILFGVVTWMLSVGAWVAVLATGRLPRTIHDMQALALGFQCRTLAHVPLLLMADYPWYERGPVLLPSRRP
jgi:hypothetical protein